MKIQRRAFLLEPPEQPLSAALAFLRHKAAAGEAFLRERHGVLIHRQTMAGAMRFTSTELGELEAKIASAGDRALALETAHFEALAGEAVAAAAFINAAGEALSRIDVAAGLAELAADLGWTRPRIGEGSAFRIEGGRHPVVEAALKRDGVPFVPNDCALGEEAGAWLRRRHRTGVVVGSDGSVDVVGPGPEGR